jgi:hypothetical protein
VRNFSLSGFIFLSIGTAVLVWFNIKGCTPHIYSDTLTLDTQAVKARDVLFVDLGNNFGIPRDLIDGPILDRPIFNSSQIQLPTLEESLSNTDGFTFRDGKYVIDFERTKVEVGWPFVVYFSYSGIKNEYVLSSSSAFRDSSGWNFVNLGLNIVVALLILFCVYLIAAIVTGVPAVDDRDSVGAVQVQPGVVSSKRNEKNCIP